MADGTNPCSDAPATAKLYCWDAKEGRSYFIAVAVPTGASLRNGTL